MRQNTRGTIWIEVVMWGILAVVVIFAFVYIIAHFFPTFSGRVRDTTGGVGELWDKLTDAKGKKAVEQKEALFADYATSFKKAYEECSSSKDNNCICDFRETRPALGGGENKPFFDENYLLSFQQIGNGQIVMEPLQKIEEGHTAIIKGSDVQVLRGDLCVVKDGVFIPYFSETMPEVLEHLDSVELIYSGGKLMPETLEKVDSVVLGVRPGRGDKTFYIAYNGQEYDIDKYIYKYFPPILPLQTKKLNHPPPLPGNAAFCFIPFNDNLPDFTLQRCSRP